MKIRIHRWYDVWHYSDATNALGEPMPTSTGYNSPTAATEAAIAHARARGVGAITLTGHVDKATAEKAGLKWVEGRGSKRRGSLAQERQRLLLRVKADFKSGKSNKAAMDYQINAINVEFAARRMLQGKEVGL